MLGITFRRLMAKLVFALVSNYATGIGNAVQVNHNQEILPRVLLGIVFVIGSCVLIDCIWVLPHIPIDRIREGCTRVLAWLDAHQLEGGGYFELVVIAFVFMLIYAILILGDLLRALI